MPLMEWHRCLLHLNASDILKLAHDPNSGVVKRVQKPWDSATSATRQNRRLQARKVSSTPMPPGHWQESTKILPGPGGGNTFGIKGQRREDSITSRQGAYYLMLLDIIVRIGTASRYRKARGFIFRALVVTCK
jgi:hypothetical protein